MSVKTLNTPKDQSIKPFLFLMFIICLVFAACTKTTETSEIPVLEFKGFSKSTMKQGAFQADSLFITLTFTDGDGDFGDQTNSTKTNIFIKDLRTNDTLSQYKAPFVPLEGVGNGISGTIRIKLYSTCCRYEPSAGIVPCTPSQTFPTNILPLEVEIQDRAGNKSNKVRLSDITLLCQ
jgi:hypothetical protein